MSSGPVAAPAPITRRGGGARRSSRGSRRRRGGRRSTQHDDRNGPVSGHAGSIGRWHTETVIAAAGIAGTVVIDPAKPVCQAMTSCSAPDGGELLVFWRQTKRVASVTTSARGTFRVALTPGIYRVTFPERKMFQARVAPSRVV